MFETYWARRGVLDAKAIQRLEEHRDRLASQHPQLMVVERTAGEQKLQNVCKRAVPVKQAEGKCIRYYLVILVGARGFEPPTPSLPD